MIDSIALGGNSKVDANAFVTAEIGAKLARVPWAAKRAKRDLVPFS